MITITIVKQQQFSPNNYFFIRKNFSLQCFTFLVEKNDMIIIIEK